VEDLVHRKLPNINLLTIFKIYRRFSKPWGCHTPRSVRPCLVYTLSLPHTRATCWANRLAWRLAQLCIFTAHVGKTTQQQHNWQNHLYFPPFCSKSHEEIMVSHWLIDSSSSALSSQHPHTLRFFPREVKNIKHDRYFPQGLERSNPHENYPHTRATCRASRHARLLAQQVSLVCGGLYIGITLVYTASSYIHELVVRAR
jgi:endogenous inhibitor of DNA gyrase (YacG/DUF329 family)